MKWNGNSINLKNLSVEIKDYEGLRINQNKEEGLIS